jgi:hypothetical protein
MEEIEPIQNISTNPVILSFDVGIIHLAYCLFTKENNNWKIIDWNNIDLSNREFTKCYCGLKASFTHNNCYYCKVHSKKCEKLKSFEEIFLPNKDLNKCNYLVKNDYCGRKSLYDLSGNCYCTTHSKAFYKKLESLYKIKPYKTKSVSQLDFDDTRLKLFKILEEKKTLLKADVVLIENQPSFKNPTMKSISTGLYDYFMIRGILDKQITQSNIIKVKFMSPSNKLKLIDSGESKQIIVLKNTNEAKAYKLTKDLSIKYTKELINHLPEWKIFFEKQKKKDDLADAFLQGCYYYEKI